MTDYTELKRLAEACKEALSLRYMENNGSLYIRNDHGIVFDVHQNRSFPEFTSANKAYADLALAANPAAVLALIAEIERLKTLRSTTERDLAQELEVWKHGPSCWNCGDTGDVHDMVGEWRGQCDCNAAKLIDVSSERGQLKAENERLKSKLEQARVIGRISCNFDAYEKVLEERDRLKEENDNLRTCRSSVNAAVVGENEALRSALKAAEDAMWHADGNMDGNAADARDALAAPGKGEQS